jgi:hypothetical protein
MEGLGLLLLLWIISTVFEKIRDAQRKLPGDERPAPRPRRQRAERAQARPLPPPTPAESAEEEWRKELERVFGIPGQTGPGGRRPDMELPGAEEVEEAESLESEPELVNIDEVALEQPARVAYDEDTGAEELVQRRIKAGEDRSHALTRADHARFDRSIRVVEAPAAAVADRTGVARRQARLSVREAFVWKEILDKPVGLRRPE